MISTRCARRFARTPTKSPPLFSNRSRPTPALFSARRFLEELREECTKHGALLIFDEVMTGFRVARGGAQEIFGIRPDLTALGKVIGGGLPVGAFGGRAEIMDQLSPDRPGLSGGNAFGQSAGDGGGSRAIARTRADRWLEHCSRNLARNLKKRLARRSAISKLPLHVSSHRFDVLSVLHRRPGVRSGQRETERSEKFASFFNVCLDRGVYFAPSQFETGFLSHRAFSAADFEANGGGSCAAALAEIDCP